MSNRPDEWRELGKYIDEGMCGPHYLYVVLMLRLGKVKPIVDSVFTFEDVLKGYERVMSSRASGKVVVKVDPAVE